MSRVIHFEIHADDVERAKTFYNSLLGWEFNEAIPGIYWLVMTGPDSEPGINGGLMHRKEGQTGDIIMAFVCTVQVDDIDALVPRVTELGGEIALSKHGIPGVGWQFYAKDTEGNVFGLHQPDPNAA